jgi:hypothetical protein
VVFNDFISRIISFQEVMVKSCQVLHPFLPCSLGDRLVGEEQRLGREQNVRDVLEAQGDYNYRFY